MKHTFLSGVLALGLGLGAVAQSTQLKITLQADQLPNPDCWLNEGVVTSNKVYLHSGLCTSGANFCRDSIAGSNSPVWEHVVGNWGQDDGIGLMSHEGNNRYSLTMIVESYYSQNISTGSTPMPNGATPYTIGFVFRSFDGGYEGKDDGCGDMYIMNIQGVPTVRGGSTGSTSLPVEVVKTVVGVEDPSYLGALVVSPNPAVERVVIDYQLRKASHDLHALILNSAGQEVTRLYDGKQAPGQHRYIWNGENAAAGLYFFVLREGDHVIANEKILLTK